MLFERERLHVVDLCIELSRRKYFAGTGGNIMMRVDETHVLVTPSAVDYLTMGASDICVLRLVDLAPVSGERAASVETAMHAGILRGRPDAGCSIHTHQPVASACAILGEELAVAPPMRGDIGPHVPVVGYGPSGTSLLSGKVARALRPDINAYLLKNHGVICIGKDSTAAVRVLDQLEELCRRHLSALIVRRKAERPGVSAALDRLLDTLNGTVKGAA